jgi:hypothetical protein
MHCAIYTSNNNNNIKTYYLLMSVARPPHWEEMRGTCILPYYILHNYILLAIRYYYAAQQFSGIYNI